MRAIFYSREAQKALDRIPVNEASRIRAKIKQFAEDPFSLANNVKALTGLPFVRLRVGNWAGHHGRSWPRPWDRKDRAERWNL